MVIGGTTGRRRQSGVGKTNVGIAISYPAGESIHAGFQPGGRANLVGTGPAGTAGKSPIPPGLYLDTGKNNLIGRHHSRPRATSSPAISADGIEVQKCRTAAEHSAGELRRRRHLGCSENWRTAETAINHATTGNLVNALQHGDRRGKSAGAGKCDFRKWIQRNRLRRRAPARLPRRCSAISSVTDARRDAGHGQRLRGPFSIYEGASSHRDWRHRTPLRATPIAYKTREPGVRIDPASQVAGRPGPWADRIPSLATRFIPTGATGVAVVVGAPATG